jgi:hypothetical protein
MSKASRQSTSKLKKIGIYAAFAAAVCLALGAVAYWLVVPGVADKLVRSKLEVVENKLGMDVEMQRVATTGISAVSLEGLKLVDPESGEPLVELGDVSASIDPFELLVGNRELSAISVRDATLYVRRHADGTTNLEHMLARAKGAEAGADKADTKPAASGDSSDSKDSASGTSILRVFGGEWPDVDIKNARVVLSADEGAQPWPVDEVSTEHTVLDSSGESASLESTLSVTRSGANPRWSIPETIAIEATLRVPLLRSTGSIEFKSPLELVGVGPYPFLRFGVGGFAVESDNTLSVRGLSLGVQGDSTPTQIASIERVSASLRSLEPSLENLRLLEVRIEKPILTIDHDAQYGSGLHDLNHLARAPLAGRVTSRAKDVIKAIAEDEGIEFEEKDDEDKGGGLSAMLAEINWTRFLGEQAPQHVTVEGAAIEVTDQRPLALESVDQTLALRDGRFDFTHRAIHGELVFHAGFTAEAGDGEPRGGVEADFKWSYRDKSMELEATVDALSLGWVVQVFRSALADKIRAGTLRADLEVKRKAKKSRIDFNGLVSVEDATVFLGAVTEEPIQDLTTSYRFDAHWDPKETVPEPKLLKGRAIAVDENVEDDAAKSKHAANTKDASSQEDGEPRPPRRGALVVTSGEAHLNGVDAEFLPAVYGLDGLRRPARFDLAVRLPKTDVMAIFEAVPEPIKGPVSGTKMNGKLSWTLDAEVPLYNAGDMEWKSKPVLEAFELVSMPEQVDVRKLRKEFELTIYDPAIEWERKVDVPQMRPIPIDFLVRHSGLEAQTFKTRRTRRQWPPRYDPGFETDPDNDGIPDLLKPHPAPWADARRGRSADANSADANSATPASTGDGLLPSEPIDKPIDKPINKPPQATGQKPTVRWKDKTKEHPYGQYTYVPLQYISPWMIRAAMTTEDNSFFKHGGFNWFALKDSVEDNLEAGGYVRGASTISMQLVKNVFLNRKKVLARKIQEAFLVWAMESVADIPKGRLLELYFNVIEYGPGIYGIHDAAVHYFGKRPDQLTLTEVAWLASIVPNPKKYHFYYERGAISDAWFRHMLRYVRVMHNRGRVTEMEYELAKNQKPEFYRPADDEPMMRLERKRSEFEQLKDDASKIEIPGLKDLFGP